MKPINVNYDRDNPEVEVATVDELSKLLDKMRQDYWEREPVMAVLTIAGEPFGNVLEVGIDRDQGVVHYTAAGQGFWSQGDQTRPGDVEYYFQEHDRPCPASAEVPYDTVKTAAAEFLLEQGQRPSTPAWQPEEI